MAEKRENSVLFSLRELRQIEEDRVRTEENQARQRVEDERAQAAAEERRRREAEERSRREIEDAARARQEELERRAREEQLRLEEAERLARVEAEAQLEVQRLRMEIDAKARENSTKRAKRLVAASATMFVMVACIAVYAYIRSKRFDQKEREIQEMFAKLQHDSDELRKQQDLLNAEVDKQVAEQKSLNEQLLKARSDKEAREIQEKIARNEAIKKAHDAEQAAIRSKQDAVRKATEAVRVNCKDPNSPLCGVN